MPGQIGGGLGQPDNTPQQALSAARGLKEYPVPRPVQGETPYEGETAFGYQQRLNAWTQGRTQWLNNQNASTVHANTFDKAGQVGVRGPAQWARDEAQGLNDRMSAGAAAWKRESESRAAQINALQRLRSIADGKVSVSQQQADLARRRALAATTAQSRSGKFDPLRNRQSLQAFGNTSAQIADTAQVNAAKERIAAAQALAQGVAGMRQGDQSAAAGIGSRDASMERLRQQYLAMGYSAEEAARRATIAYQQSKATYWQNDKRIQAGIDASNKDTSPGIGEILGQAARVIIGAAMASDERVKTDIQPLGLLPGASQLRKKRQPDSPLIAPMIPSLLSPAQQGLSAGAASVPMMAPQGEIPTIPVLPPAVMPPSESDTVLRAGQEYGRDVAPDNGDADMVLQAAQEQDGKPMSMTAKLALIQSLSGFGKGLGRLIDKKTSDRRGKREIRGLSTTSAAVRKRTKDDPDEELAKAFDEHQEKRSGKDRKIKQLAGIREAIKKAADPDKELARAFDEHQEKRSRKDREAEQSPLDDALDKVKPYAYRYKPGIEDGGKEQHIGVMAQDLAASDAGATVVGKDEKGVMNIKLPEAVTFSLASLARMNERLKQLEKGGKRA